MKKIIYSFIVLFLAFMAIGISAQAQSKKVYVVKDGVTLFEREITNIDSIMFVSATFYTITYHANGESVTIPAAQKVLAGSTCNVATLPGYDPDTAEIHFNGWNTKADGSGDLYTPGVTLTVEKNIDFYAEWTTSSGSLETDDYTVRLKKVEGSTTWEGIAIPIRLFSGKIEAATQYTIHYTLKSNVNLNSLFFMPADVSQGLLEDYYYDGFTNLQPRLLGNPTSVYDIIANTEMSGTLTNYTLSSPYGRASNESDLANCIYLMCFSENASSIELTFSDLAITITKDEEVTLISLIANGSVGVKTTQLSMVFDKPIDLTEDEVRLYDYMNHRYYSIEGDLTGSGRYYTLGINPSQSLVNEDEDIRMGIGKRGYIISYAPGINPVKIYTGLYTPPSAHVGRVIANGNPATTTQLTWDIQVEEGRGPFNLTRDEVIIQGLLVTKGTLSVADGGLIGDGRFRKFTYTLPISGFTTGGNITLSVIKPGWDINYFYIQNSTNICYGYENIKYNGFLGRGYDILNSEYYNSMQVKTEYALNMKKLVGEGKVTENRHNYRLTDNYYIVGESISKYSKELSAKASLSGGFGFFKASASFGYSSSNSIETHESFATCKDELIKESHYVSGVSLADLRTNYLDDIFKSQWLLNPNVSAETLFRNYGTHIFLTVYLGGRMDMSFVYHNQSEEKRSEIHTKIKASYAMVKGEASFDQETMSSTFVSKSEERVKSYGGNIGLNFSTFASAVSNYDAWANSIETTNNLAVVRGGELDMITQMIPIWELIDPSNTSRRKAIKDEFDRILLENGGIIMGLQQERVTPPNTHVYGVEMGFDKNNNALAESDLRSRMPSGYTVNIVPGNLRSGRSDYMRIGYTETTNANVGITDIKAVRGTNLPLTKVINGKTYHSFGYTLSKNKSNCLYACWVEDSPGAATIKDIFMEINGDLSGMEGIGWERVKWTDGTNANTSEGAGGDTVYIWIRK